MKNLNWWTVLEAHYGVNLSPSMQSVWEMYLKEHSITNHELCEIIEQASIRDITPRGYKVTVADLIHWVQMSRRAWSKTVVRGL